MNNFDIVIPKPNAPYDAVLEQELVAYWHYEREFHFRLDRRTIWSSYVAHLTVFNDNPPIKYPTNKRFHDFCNKPTCFYFAASSHPNMPPRIVFAAIFEAWRNCCGEYWNPEYGHFIANPVQIMERGPKTLPEIMEIHQEMCAFVKEHEPKDENYRMHKSYPQVVLVCDKVPCFDAAVEDDGLVSLRKVAEQQTVLVVKGKSSTDISFDDLAPHALPLERSDVMDLDVLRVPLSIAVKYMFELETRMGESQGKNPNKFDTEMYDVEVPLGFDSVVRRHPAMWAAAMTKVAQTHGNGSMGKFGWPAGRIAAGIPGQPFELEQDPWKPGWKFGYE